MSSQSNFRILSQNSFSIAYDGEVDVCDCKTVIVENTYTSESVMVLSPQTIHSRNVPYFYALVDTTAYFYPLPDDELKVAIWQDYPIAPGVYAVDTITQSYNAGCTVFVVTLSTMRKPQSLQSISVEGNDISFPMPREYLSFNTTKSAVIYFTVSYFGETATIMFNEVPPLAGVECKFDLPSGNTPILSHGIIAKDSVLVIPSVRAPGREMFAAAWSGDVTQCDAPIIVTQFTLCDFPPTSTAPSCAICCGDDGVYDNRVILNFLRHKYNTKN